MTRAGRPTAGTLYRIQPLARAAYGVQIVATMFCFGGIALFFMAAWAAIKVGAIDGNAARGVVYWLAGWGISIGTVAMSVATALFAWRYSGDWVTEWPGYVTGVIAALVALAVLFWLVFGTDLAVELAVFIPAAALFVFGFGVAGRLGGQKAPGARLRPRLSRRR